jgi:hypothetical protein
VCEISGFQQNLMLEPNVSQLAKELSLRLIAVQKRYSERKSTPRKNEQAVALPK